MREWNNILLVCQPGTNAKTALGKVKRLANIESETIVSAVRVTYDASIKQISHDDESADALQSYAEDAAKLELEAAIDRYQPDIEQINCHTVWDENIAQGILRAAEKLDADVIVKPISQDGEQRFLRTPDDWNLLRSARTPVLLCGARAWTTKPALLAAVDVLDESHEVMNTRILRLATGLAAALEGRLGIVAAYPSVAFWSANPSIFNSYQSTLAKSRSNATEGMTTLLESLEIESAAHQVLEGDPEAVIQKVVEESGAELLVIGNSRRNGVPGLLLGNTAERLVYAIAEDLLCVP